MFHDTLIPPGLFNMRIFYLAMLLSLVQFTPIPASTTLPSCFQIASDQDGDGYGYGWNGIGTCLVEKTINPACEDTDPTGDG